MHTQNTKIHSQIALAIKSSKRLMFNRHRSGIDLPFCAGQFVKDVNSRLEHVLDCGGLDALGVEAPPEDDQETEAARQRVLDALHELLHNPETPSDLFQECSEFVTDQSNECGQSLYQSTPYLTEVLGSVKPEDRMGAVRAAREAKEKGVCNEN